MQGFKEFIPGTGLVATAQQKSNQIPTSPSDRRIGPGSPSRSFPISQPDTKDPSQRLKAQAKEFIPNLPPQESTHYPQYVESGEWYLNHSSQSRETAENLVEVMIPCCSQMSSSVGDLGWKSYLYS
jgi:hypothetical protein